MMNVHDITYLWPGPNPMGPREKWGQGRLQFGRYLVCNPGGHRLVIRMLHELYLEGQSATWNYSTFSSVGIMS